MLALAVPLWLAVVFLHLAAVQEGRLAWFPWYVDVDALAAPFVRGCNPAFPQSCSGLSEGDRILSVGGEAMAGAGRLQLLSAAYRHADASLQVPVEIERAGQPMLTALTLAPAARPWRALPSIAFGLFGIFGLLRARGSTETRAFAWASLAYSPAWLLFFGGQPWQVAAATGVLALSSVLFPPLTVRAALLFPRRIAVRSKLVRVAPWLLGVNGVAVVAWLFDEPLSARTGLALNLLTQGLLAVSLLVVLAYQYARASAVERRQLKWVLLGFYVGLAPVAAAALLRVFDQAFDRMSVYHDAALATAVIPPCILIAIHRYDFLDINRLVTSTVAASLFTILLATGGLALVPDMANAASVATGVAPGPLRMALFLILAAVLFVGARAAHPFLQRFFAPESYRLAAGVRRSSRELAACETPDALLEGFGAAVSDMLRLRSCVLYGRTRGGFVPIFVRGPAVPHTFELEGPVVRALAEANDPVLLSGFGSGRRTTWLEGTDRAVLEALRTEIVLPIRHRDGLTAFVCLGEKKSGDLYPRADLALLDQLADMVSLRIERFERREVEASQRALQQRVADLHTCFLSYASPDEEFARRLYGDLDTAGVRCWFAPETLRTGEQWHEALDMGLATSERLFVVLSKHALTSTWVAYEVERALAREEEGSNRSGVLFPLRVDDSFRDTRVPWAVRVRERIHVADFRNWRDEPAYRTSFDRLLEDLRREPEARSDHGPRTSPQ